MTLISLQGKTNFFEKRVSSTPRPALALKIEQQFCLDADF